LDGLKKGNSSSGKLYLLTTGSSKFLDRLRKSDIKGMADQCMTDGHLFYSRKFLKSTILIAKNYFMLNASQAVTKHKVSIISVGQAVKIL